MTALLPINAHPTANGEAIDMDRLVNDQNLDRFRRLVFSSELDFGQFEQPAGDHILWGKLIRQRISSLSRLGRDSEEISAPHVLGLEPSLTHSNFGQSQAQKPPRDCPPTAITAPYIKTTAMQKILLLPRQKCCDRRPGSFYVSLCLWRRALLV